MNVNILQKRKTKTHCFKDALNIDGLGKKVVDQFWSLNLIRNPSDIFVIKYEKLKSLEGWESFQLVI